MRGKTMCTQSAEAPWRTYSALMKAMNDIVIVQMPTQMPLRDASACANRTLGAAAALTDGYVVDDMIFPSLFEVATQEFLSFREQPHSVRSASRRLRRILHDVIALRTLYAVLIGIVINDRMLISKIIPGRRRRNAPFERGAFPRIFRSRLTLEVAVDQIKDKDELSRTRTKSRDGDELV